MPANLNQKQPSSLLASDGIGRATALLLAESGLQVALVSMNGDRLQQLANQIHPGGGTAVSVGGACASALSYAVGRCRGRSA